MTGDNDNPDSSGALDDDISVDDSTVMASVPEELIAESIRPDQPPAAPPLPSKGGLGPMFGSSDDARDLLPTEAEGDALLDMLFDDAEVKDEDVGAAALAPPLPARPAASPAAPEALASPLGGRPAFGSVDTDLPIDDSDTADPLDDEEDQPTAYRPPARSSAITYDGEENVPPMPAAPPTPPRPGNEPPPFPGVPGPAAKPAPPMQHQISDEMTSPLPDVMPRLAQDLAQGSIEVEEDPFAASDVIDAEAALEALGAEPEEIDAGALASVAPSVVPMPSRPPGEATFSDEREASLHLAEQEQIDTWAARAAWLREEAEAIEDKAVRARTLSAVVEIAAMAGEDEAADAVAREVHQLAPASPMAAQQYRWIVGRAGDWQATLDVLDAENRAMPTAEARAHGSLLAAEICRIKLGDADGAKKRVDNALRTFPTDARGHLTRFAEALALKSDESVAAIGRIRPPDDDSLEALVNAFGIVAAQRRPNPKGGEAQSPFEALLRARAALAAQDVGTAVETLAAMEGEQLGQGHRWLAALLGAARKETRPAAVESLRAAAGGSHGPLARRQLAGVAIELGDAAAAEAASDDTSSFSPADRVALAALTGAKAEQMQSLVAEAIHDAESSALVAAASAVAGAGRIGVGSDRARAVAELGQQLASISPELPQLRSNEALVAAVDNLDAAAPQDGAARALGLEFDLEAGAASRVAHTLAHWSEASATARDRSLAAALSYELAGEVDRLLASLEEAATADPTFEAIARVRGLHGGNTLCAALLAELAESVDDPTRASLTLSEAGARLWFEDEAESSEAFLQRAVELDPTLPIAAHLGERLSRTRGDRDGLLEWLRARREASDDGLEQAHDLVREALLVSDEEGAPGAALLEQALASRPEDVGLRELFERLAMEPPSDRAAWREGQLDRGQEGPERNRFAIEAAYEHERLGDLESAARCAKVAAAGGEMQLAPIAIYRYALAGHGTGDLVDEFLPQARATEDPDLRIEMYERLADLDELGRNDLSSGLLWRRSILEERPQHLPTLRQVASSLVTAGRDEEFAPFALEIAKTLEGPESLAHAAVAYRYGLRDSWEETREAVEAAYKTEPRTIWALRQSAAHARVAGEHRRAAEADTQLLDMLSRPAERATVALRAAESCMEAESLDAARELLLVAVDEIGEDLVIQTKLASVLSQQGQNETAAQMMEAAASAAESPGEKGRAYFGAGVLWQDKVEDLEKARAAFERVVELDPSNGRAFERLQAIYTSSGARAELAELLERRLESISDPTERVEMEVLRGRALAEVGDAGAAKRALAAALDESPDHVDALEAFARLCLEEGDWGGAEQAFIRLARLVPDAEAQAAIYLQLGGLYDEHIPNAERAEVSYQEILKRLPNDVNARERLVALHTRTGDIERAMEQQNVLVGAASTPEEKCLRTVELGGIFEAAGDAKKAEQTLVQARKQFPKDVVALRALVEYYQRADQAQAATVLLDRSAADARRALGTGRFEAFLFATLATVAELKGKPAVSEIAEASVAALEGRETDIAGAFSRAGDTSLDELLAPDLMTQAFRELLKRTGPLLDTAVPYDLAAIRATPMPQGALLERVRELAAAYGLPGIEVHTTNVLGSVCIPASAHPPTIVLGESLVAAPEDDVRDFLLHRALKVIQANATPLARTAPIDLWPLVAAYLKVFTPNWQPQGVDAARLTEAYGKLSRVASQQTDGQVPLLAAEVIGTIGNRASTMNTVINGWGNRAGLLAVGDPNVALKGIAWAGGHTNAPPDAGKQRLTWVGRNAEARDVVVFSVSDAYADARSKLGL